MDCGKVKFTKKDAEAALKFIRKKGRQHQREQRKYFCTDCNAWHLTSKPDTMIKNTTLTYPKKWKRLIKKRPW